jgi:hypothetical protein
MSGKGEVMRRMPMAIALVALAAAALAAPAAAKWTLEVGPARAGLGPGDPWRLEIRVVGDHVPSWAGPPVVRIRNVERGRSLAFRAQPVAEQPRRTFVAMVRFPAEGRWRYVVRHAGATFAFGQIVIAAPKPAPATQVAGPKASPAPGSDDGGLPLGPLLGGIAGAVLLGGVGLAWIRMRRLPPWPTAPSSARTASKGR